MKHLFYIFIAVLLAGCAENGGKADMASATTPYDSIIQANGYEALPLFKTRTGHITVSLQVNGKPCVFLVDTGGGATLIDISKKDLYQLEPQAIRDYAAGIGSARSIKRELIPICELITPNKYEAEILAGMEIRNDSLFLMDISYVNAEFKKNRSRRVDGVLGTDFLERYHAIIDYSRLTLYLKTIAVK